MEARPNIEEIDLQKYILVLQRRWIHAAGVCGIFVTLASVLAFSGRAAYMATGSMLIKTDTTSSLTGLGQGLGQIQSLTSLNNPLETQARILLSVPVMKEAIKELNLKDDKGQPIPVDDLIQSLRLEVAKGTEILDVSYADYDPAFAAKVVNKIMEIYIKNNIETNRAVAVLARKFIVEQIPGSEKSVREAESALRKFKEQNKIISLEQEAVISVQLISQLEQQLSQAQSKLADVTAQSQQLQSEANIDPRQAVTFASLSQTPGIQQALVQLQEAQTQLAVQKNTLQPSHPTIISLEAKVASLKNLLDGRIQEIGASNQQVSMGNLQIGPLRQNLIGQFVSTEAQRVGLVKQITTLSNQWSAYKQRANILPKLEQTQRELERQLNASQKTYEALLAKLQEVQLAENQTIGNARVVSPALVPEKPSGGRKLLIIIGGAVVGGIVGIIAAFTVDLIDRSVKTVQEAKELFPYTLLGVIPAFSKKSSFLPGVEQQIPKVIGRDIPQFPVGDAYQMLQANLKFLSSDKKPKAIVVTSSIPKEGKSEVAANLAVSMAQLGHRVLLVDADMRHPVQHHIWSLTNVVGLSNVMVDQVSLHTAIDEVMPNLYVLPSGVVPPNPVALLDSKRMASLVTSFAADYDYVIFDTPALSGMADASVLSKLADGVLLVVRPGVLNYSSANAAKDYLKQSGQHVLGMVINGVNVKQEPDSYFYYSQRNALEYGSVSRNSLVPKEVASKVTRKGDASR
jgi:succinoglycan biosynthesis transport protein ExoP